MSRREKRRERARRKPREKARTARKIPDLATPPRTETVRPAESYRGARRNKARFLRAGHARPLRRGTLIGDFMDKRTG